MKHTVMTVDFSSDLAEINMQLNTSREPQPHVRGGQGKKFPSRPDGGGGGSSGGAAHAARSGRVSYVRTRCWLRPLRAYYRVRPVACIIRLELSRVAGLPVFFNVAR